MTGKEIKALRLGAKMTQAELAEALWGSKQSVHGWEAGRYLPSPEAELRLKLFFHEGKRAASPLPRSHPQMNPGMRFGELETLKRIAPAFGDSNARWLCLCHLCGQQCTKVEGNLPKSKSCGTRACVRKVRETSRPPRGEVLRAAADPSVATMRAGFANAVSRWLETSGFTAPQLEKALRLDRGAIERWLKRYPLPQCEKSNVTSREGAAKIKYVPVGSGFVDLTGQRFGSVLVVARAGSNSQGAAMWHVRCDCGRIYQARGTAIRHYGWRRCRACARGLDESQATQKGSSKDFIAGSLENK